MRYISTRGTAPVRDFAGVLLAGLAEDGGLYVPDTFPQFSATEWRAMRGLPYAELAFRIMQPFVGDALPPATLHTLCREAYAAFGHPAVVPLVQLDTGLWVQERDTANNWAADPLVTADSSGNLTGWVTACCGDTRISGTYYVMVSLQPADLTSALNAPAPSTSTVLDAATAAFRVHNGVATAKPGNAPAEAVADGTTTVWSLGLTELNGVDDDGDGVVDNEGTTGSFHLAVPLSQTFDVRLSGAAWLWGMNISGSRPDVDIALGGTDQQAPYAPEALDASADGATNDLAWSEADDDIEVTAYEIYRWTDPVQIGNSLNYTSRHVPVARVTGSTGWTDNAVTAGTSYYYEVRALDAAGNVGPPSPTAYVDRVPPATTSNAPAGWQRGAVTVTLTPADGLSGMSGGAAGTFYRMDGGAWQAGTSVVLPVWRRGGGNGDHVVDYYSVDATGNAETAKTIHVKIDTQPPRTADDAPAEPRASPVTVHLTPTDPFSGVASTSWRLDSGSWTTVPGSTGTSVVVPADPGTHWIMHYSTDLAGNVETLRLTSVTITAPARATAGPVRGSRHHARAAARTPRRAGHRHHGVARRRS